MSKEIDKLIFVYGTLMRGCGNNGYLQDPGVEFIATGHTLEFYNMSFNGSFPAVHESMEPRVQVRGEVFRVKSSSVLEHLDRLEGFHNPKSPNNKEQNFYYRKPITIMLDTGSTVEAEIYFCNSFFHYFVSSGDFHTALEEREKQLKEEDEKFQLKELYNDFVSAIDAEEVEEFLNDISTDQLTKLEKTLEEWRMMVHNKILESQIFKG